MFDFLKGENIERSKAYLQLKDANFECDVVAEACFNLSIEQGNKDIRDFYVDNVHAALLKVGYDLEAVDKAVYKHYKDIALTFWKGNLKQKDKQKKATELAKK